LSTAVDSQAGRVGNAFEAGVPARGVAKPQRSSAPSRAEGSAPQPSPAPGTLEVVLGSGYLEKQRKFLKEKRRSTRRRLITLVLVPVIGVMVTAVLLVTRRIPLWVPVVSLFALWGIGAVVERIGFPLLDRLREEEESYARGKAAEDRLTEILSRHLDSRWTLFRNVVLPDRPDDIDAILLGPPGVLALEVKAYRGLYRNIGDRWETRRGRQWQAAGSNPTTQALGNAARLRAYLRGILGEEVWVEPRVVWAGTRRLIYERPRVYIWQLERSEDWLRELSNDRALAEETLARIRVALRALCSTLR
jgi:hypothetical protein